jgi:hypothetical protein
MLGRLRRSALRHQMKCLSCSAAHASVLKPRLTCSGVAITPCTFIDSRSKKVDEGAGSKSSKINRFALSSSSAEIRISGRTPDDSPSGFNELALGGSAPSRLSILKERGQDCAGPSLTETDLLQPSYDLETFPSWRISSDARFRSCRQDRRGTSWGRRNWTIELLCGVI